MKSKKRKSRERHININVIQNNTINIRRIAEYFAAKYASDKQ